MTIFDDVKDLLNIEQVALYYGVEVKRGKAICPFHKDKHPSMSFKNNRYKCWTCGASGSVIDFVSNLFRITPVEAIKQLAKDFSLNVDITSPANEQVINKRKIQLQRLRAFEQWVKDYRNILVERLKRLEAIISSCEPLNYIWCNSIREYEIKQYHWEILHTGTTSDKAELYNDIKKRGQENCSLKPQQKKLEQLKIS